MTVAIVGRDGAQLLTRQRQLRTHTQEQRRGSLWAMRRGDLRVGGSQGRQHQALDTTAQEEERRRYQGGWDEGFPVQTGPGDQTRPGQG